MKTIVLPKRSLLKKSKTETPIFDEAAFIQSKRDMYEDMGIAIEDSFDGDLFI
ncbi:MAG: hypothetical protein K0U54_14040 [Bacteroidetes bacterium]|nr:hypothetical protein [Bacteroidota bacterium]